MIAKILNKQATYLVSLFMLFASPSQATSTSAWFYNDKLVTPADSRAVLKPYQHLPTSWQLNQKSRLKQWLWFRHQKVRRDKQPIPDATTIPQSQPTRALPFWPDLKPK